jgi:sulfite exporter TauE/SafE
MIELLAALVLGLASSVHCVAMCGPLLLALHRPAGGAGSTTRVACHHTGRLATYAGFGLIAGSVGRLAAVAGFGRGLTVTAGAFLLVGVIARAGVFGRGRTMVGPGRVIARGLAAMRRRAEPHPVLGALLLGGLNGLLPCTPVYAAVTAATAMPDPSRAVAFMLLFGLGTIPSLVLVSALAAKIPPVVRRRAVLVTPVAIGLLGLLLIARGLPIGATAHAIFHSHRH